METPAPALIQLLHLALVSYILLQALFSEIRRTGVGEYSTDSSMTQFTFASYSAT